MKKYGIILVFCISLIITISGCKKQPEVEEVVDEEYINKLNNYVYNYTISALNKSSTKKRFIPDSLRTELQRTFIVNGEFKTGIEILFPDKIDLNEYLNVYDCHSDNGFWVDELLATMEAERIAEELQEMKELAEAGAFNTSSNIVNEIITNEIADHNNNLSFMEFDNEVFIPQKKGDELIVIHGCEDNVERYFFDKFYRCYREETWKIDSLGSQELLETVDTKFRGNSYILTEKLIKNKKEKKSRKFNTKGLLAREDVYNILDNKEYIISTQNFKYNNDDTVSESILLQCIYNNENFDDLLYTFEKKYVYKYNSDDIPPNFDYYEDGVLKINKSYSTKDNYVSKIFFDDDFSVTTFYENGKLKKEVFSLKDGKERIKNYD